MAALALVIALLAAAESGGEVGATKHCGSGFMISALPQVVYDNQPSKMSRGNQFCIAVGFAVMYHERSVVYTVRTATALLGPPIVPLCPLFIFGSPCSWLIADGKLKILA